MTTRRARRRTIAVAVLLWTAGAVALWLLLPPLPRSGYGFLDGRLILGTLSDGRTVATVSHGLKDRDCRGPVELWDIATGDKVGACFGPDDRFHSAPWVAAGDRMMVIEKESGEPDPHTFRLRLCDARSGRETVWFACHVPKDNVWWEVSPDGSLSAVVDHADGPKVVLYDNATGRAVHTFPGHRETIRFSPDGRRFAAARAASGANGLPTCLTVWDVPAGREVLSTPPWSKPNRSGSPARFSPDGNWLLDDFCRVWDLITGREQLTLTGTHAGAAVFTRDSRTLVAEHATPAGSAIRWHDLATGDDRADHDLIVGPPERGFVYLRPSDGGRFIASAGSQLTPQPAAAWLVKQFPTLSGRLKTHHLSDVTVVVDAETGREVSRGHGFGRFTPDGTGLILQDREGRVTVWDVPPKPPIALFLASATGLGLLIGWLTRRRLRRPRKAPSPPAVAPSAQAVH